jgi:flagellar basal body rod protein FlgC
MAISAISSGVSGIQQAASRFEASANRIARSGTGLAEVDIVSEIVTVVQSEHEFAANAKVISAVSDMQKSAIDILV